jgi:hypothetical protein
MPAKPTVVNGDPRSDVECVLGFAVFLRCDHLVLGEITQG